jgi:chemotaxis protein MotB
MNHKISIMKKLIFAVLLPLLFTSCISKKQYADLETRFDASQQELTNTKANLQKCLISKTDRSGRVIALEEQLAMMKQQNQGLKETNKQSLKQVENLTVLTQSASNNIKDVISQLSEKDKYINGIRSAMTQKDSINLALAFHLKRELSAGIQDEDIQIDVEKTVVYISLSDKLLFTSGGSTVLPRAKQILGKVATVVSSRPDMEVMVEGHTDNVAISSGCIKDNWDLSVKRATAVLRVLQNDYGISPSRLVAAGRSEFVPLASNDTSEGRSRNRRTRIVILPKLDQFFDILEQKPE